MLFVDVVTIFAQLLTIFDFELTFKKTLAIVATGALELY